LRCSSSVSFASQDKAFDHASEFAGGSIYDISRREFIAAASSQLRQVLLCQPLIEQLDLLVVCLRTKSRYLLIGKQALEHALHIVDFALAIA